MEPRPRIQEEDALLSSPKSKLINSSRDSSSPPGYDEVVQENSFRTLDGCWRKYSCILLPVEVVAFLFLFGVYFQMQLYQQYYFQRIFRDIIKNWTNVSELNYSIYDMCLSQDQIVNLTSSESFVSGQREINVFSMLTTICYLLPSILVSPLVGTLSDQIGRKPVIFFVFVGQLIAAILGPCIVYLNLSMFYFFLCSAITGLFGGFGVMLSSNFAYVTDITPKKWLTIRMAILEASIFVAVAISSAVSDSWIQQTGCSFRPQVWVALATVTAGMLYTLVIPESLDEKHRIHKLSDFKCGFSRLVQGFKLFFWPSYIGKNVWKMWVIVVVIALAMINETGTTEISSYFLHNKPLQWDYGTIGLYLAINSVSHLLALVVILPILVVLKLPDSLIGLVGLVVSCGMSVYIALLTTTVEMFTVGIIIGIQSVVIPSVRAILARFLNEDDRGAAFSLVAVFQLLATLIASIVFNLVYTPEDLDNKRDNPKVVYWMVACIWAAAIPLVSLLLISDIVEYIQKKKKIYIKLQ